MDYVLEPLSLKELNNIFDEKAISILDYLMTKYVYAQPEVQVSQKHQGIQIPKEHLEQWCVQALGASPVGAGNYPIDIKKNDWGADIKSLACQLTNNIVNNSKSGEASLAQNFKGAGKILDKLFANKEYEIIKDEWLDIVFQKNANVIKKEGIKNIYYFFFLRGYKEFYLCGTKFNLENLKNVEVDYTTESSVFLSNYINHDYGYTNVYKAKKRLELRLFPMEWIKNNHCIKISLPNQMPATDLRKVDLKQYMKKSRDVFFK